MLILAVVSILDFLLGLMFAAAAAMELTHMRQDALAPYVPDYQPASLPLATTIVDAASIVLGIVAIVSAFGVWSNRRAYAIALAVSIALLALPEVAELAFLITKYGLESSAHGYLIPLFIIAWSIVNAWILRRLGKI